MCREELVLEDLHASISIVYLEVAADDEEIKVGDAPRPRMAFDSEICIDGV